MGWFQGLIDKISSISLPDWLTPGSPTPFEIGLRGIADALRNVDANIGGLTVNASRPVIAAGGPIVSTGGGTGAMAFQIIDQSTISLSDSSDAERKLRPIVSKLVREAMSAR